MEALLRSFITDEVIQKSHDELERAKQTDGEDEGKIAEKLSKAAWICRHVFKSNELVNLYISRLKNAVRQIVELQVRQFHHEDQSILSAVRKVAVVVGRFLRALLADVEKWRSLQRSQNSEDERECYDGDATSTGSGGVAQMGNEGSFHRL